MRLHRGLIFTVIIVAFVYWLLTPNRHARPMAGAAGQTVSAYTSQCPLPAIVADGDEPLQSRVPSGLVLPAIEDASVTALAGFSVQARVLGRENYRFGREADFSPMDLALGWGRMRDDAVVASMQISQGGRWYHYRWTDTPPLPLAEIIRSSANMHMVPANTDVARALGRIEVGQYVRIDGWLVEIDAAGRWRWKSSLSRSDSGGGACELVYVCSVTRY